MGLAPKINPVNPGEPFNGGLGLNQLEKSFLAEFIRKGAANRSETMVWLQRQWLR